MTQDKILIIDLMNNVWRANVGFGKKNQTHNKCTIAYCNHTLTIPHCTCGQQWLLNDDICFSQTPDDYVLIFNFFRNLRPLIEQFSPDKVFIVDEGHPEHRFELYADYKANRIVKTAEKQESKDKLFKSKEEIVKLLLMMPITYCKAEKFEADDVIATLCEDLKNEDITVLSGDSDFVQLLQRGYSSCKVYSPIKKEFAVAPKWNYAIAKSLLGDKADNIPKLLSPKKAEACLTDPEKFKQFLSIEENRANFSINKKLIDFAEVPLEEIIMINGENNFDKLKREFDRMKFNSITNDNSWNKYVNTFNCIKF